jgi:hypothetical protein
MPRILVGNAKPRFAEYGLIASEYVLSSWFVYTLEDNGGA